MASVQSAQNSIAEARGQLLSILQDNDEYDGFAGLEWSDLVFQATEDLKSAQQHLDRAELS